MYERFMELANEIHNATEAERWCKWKEFVQNGEEIYLYFKLWCYRNSMEEEITTRDRFNEYLKIKKIPITETQRKYLAKKYFGYKESAINEDGKDETE